MSQLYSSQLQNFSVTLDMNGIKGRCQGIAWLMQGGLLSKTAKLFQACENFGA